MSIYDILMLIVFFGAIFFCLLYTSDAADE